MKTKVDRRTVDLSGYQDLVVVYLGMRVNVFGGVKTVLGYGPKIAKAVEAQWHVAKGASLIADAER